jgi:Uma2 family endonuclease
MVAVARKRLFISPETYLERERKAEFKSEYLEGEIYAMAGGSPRHSHITANVIGALWARLQGKPCRVLSSDMKVRASREGLYAYPDVSVVCGEMQFHDEHEDVLTNPIVIVEVLSPSTEAYDRGKKFHQYQQIATLQHYLLVAQDTPCIDHYFRQDDGFWRVETVMGLDGQVVLNSLDIALALAQVYEKVDFPAPPDTAEPEPNNEGA